MLEKAIDRLIRQNFLHDNQIPVIVQTAKNTIAESRIHIQSYKHFGNVPSYITLVTTMLEELSVIVADLIKFCPCGAGQKQRSKTRKEVERHNLIHSIKKMLNRLKSYYSTKTTGTEMAEHISESFLIDFKKWCEEHIKSASVKCISGRGSQTCIFPLMDIDLYMSKISNNEWFKRKILAKIGRFVPESGHKDNCDVSKRKYRLKGYRPNNRQVIVPGRKLDTPVRMIQCTECKKVFSVLPSFISREKHYSINLIGRVLEGVFLRGVCINYAQEMMDLTGFPVKSKQTVLNWMKWIGRLHPAELLNRSGVSSSGYFQEDEGFQKEPNLRTYVVAMVDSSSQVVWHIDYIDHVDEERLYQSFQSFVEKISFKLKGVTKDKWQASTKALKSLFEKLWIGYCHRHCLHKFKKALDEYKKSTGAEDKIINELYKKFSRVLSEARHGVNMEVKVDMLLKEEEFNHPLLKERLDELKKNAVNYTANKMRSGIKKTTSLVDNFLKLAKRKLREAMSFRDQEWSGIFFKGLANVRNFVEFKAGAKNAHKSPFVLAGGENFELPWMEVLNVHNGFLS
jgi:hypothetical protein